MDDAPPLHPDLEPVAFLLGTWRGQGHGQYPTIEPFDYLEEVRFWHVGKPMLAYSQTTRDPDTGAPMHSEMGYWRCIPGDPDDAQPARLEVVLSHPTGISEVSEGTVSGLWLDLATTSVVCTPTAKRVEALTRRIEVDADVLRYTLSMAAVGQPLTHHLSAELERA